LISKEVDNQLWETLLKLAVAQNHYHELIAIPSEDELSGQYSFSPQFSRRMRSLIWKDKTTRVKRSFSQYSVKIAISIAIILALTFGTVMTIPEVRATVVNVIIEWFDTNTSFRFSGNVPSQETSNLWQPSYLPQDFHEFSTTKTGAMTTVIYKNDEKLIYFVYAQAHDGYSLSVDNEHSYYAQININGVKADLFKAQTEEDCSHIIWQENGTSLHLISTISYEELIKMAESMGRQK